MKSNSQEPEDPDGDGPPIPVVNYVGNYYKDPSGENELVTKK